MARKERAISTTGVYHAMFRGVNHQCIFQDNEDRFNFLKKLSKIKKRSGCSIYAYCLMDNHVHLLIDQGSESISQIMKDLGSTYALWYNKKHDRVGHLFQGRFHSEPVNVERYFVTALRYIHQNPVKARMSQNCGSYVWTSYHDYVNDGNAPKGLTDTDLGLSISGGLKEFIELHNEIIEEYLQDFEGTHRTSDSLASELINEVITNKKKANIFTLNIEERNRLLRELKGLPGVSNRQIEKATGLNRNVVQRA